MSAIQVFCKHCGKKEKLLVISIFSFSQCFLLVWRTFCHFHQIWNCCLGPLSVWKILKCVISERVKLSNPFPNKPWFLRVCSTSLENTVGKGEIARNEQFLLFPQCFLLFWRFFCHFHQNWNCRLKPFWVWKRLKFVIWERVKSFTVNALVIPEHSFFLSHTDSSHEHILFWSFSVSSCIFH